MVKEHKRIIGYIEKGAYNKASEFLKIHIKKSHKYKINALKDHLKQGMRDKIIVDDLGIRS